MGLRAICIQTWWHSWVVLIMYACSLFDPRLMPRKALHQGPPDPPAESVTPTTEATSLRVLKCFMIQIFKAWRIRVKLQSSWLETSLRQVRPCDSCGEMRKTTNFSRGEEVPFLVLQRCSNTKRKWLSEAVLDWVPMALCCLSAHQWRLDEVDEGREFPDATWTLKMF